jgi:hypothetical protein
MTPADYCRAQGWKVGDVLEYQHGQHERIAITAIGLNLIYAIKQNASRVIYEREWIPEETSYNLHHDYWRKVGHMDSFAEELVWPE